MSSLPRSVVELATVVGLDGAAIARAAGVSESALTDPDGRVPIECYRRMFEQLADEPRQWEGMRLILGLDSLAPLGVLGYVLASSPTVQSAFSAYERHATVIGEVFEFDVRSSAASFVLRFRVPHELQRYALFNMGTVVLNTTVVRILTGSDLAPKLIELPNAHAEHLIDPSTLIRSEVRFGADHTALHYEPAVASLPVRSSDPALYYFVERHAQQLRSALAHPTTWAARTRQALLERLRGAAPSADEIARVLGTSARTLARRLEEEDQTFKDVLEETRRDLAVSYVRDQSLPLGEVAFLLGYGEVASFHKAFRRWTGVTPGEARRAGLT